MGYKESVNQLATNAVKRRKPPPPPVYDDREPVPGTPYYKRKTGSLSGKVGSGLSNNANRSFFGGGTKESLKKRRGRSNVPNRRLV